MIWTTAWFDIVFELIGRKPSVSPTSSLTPTRKDCLHPVLGESSFPPPNLGQRRPPPHVNGTNPRNRSIPVNSPCGGHSFFVPTNITNMTKAWRLPIDF